MSSGAGQEMVCVSDQTNPAPVDRKVRVCLQGPCLLFCLPGDVKLSGTTTDTLNSGRTLSGQRTWKMGSGSHRCEEESPREMTAGEGHP